MVYASVFGAVLASVRSLRTQVIAFDTAVADLTDLVTDPVELLFGVQLGGGTDINSALAYCQTRIENPGDTIFVLISDLYEGGDNEEMLRRAQAMAAGGLQMVCLLALSDDGAPSYDHDNAAALAALGIPPVAGRDSAASPQSGPTAFSPPQCVGSSAARLACRGGTERQKPRRSERSRRSSQDT